MPLCDQKLSKSNAWPADPTLVVDRPQVTAVRSGDAVGDASRYSTVLEVPA